MQDLFYKFLDEPAMLDALRPLGMTYTDENGIDRVSQGGPEYATWIVGEIEGYEGYHLNVRQIDPDFNLSSLVGNEVHPTAPKVIWS